MKKKTWSDWIKFGDTCSPTQTVTWHCWSASLLTRRKTRHSLETYTNDDTRFSSQNRATATERQKGNKTCLDRPLSASKTLLWNLDTLHFLCDSILELFCRIKGFVSRRRADESGNRVRHRDITLFCASYCCASPEPDRSASLGAISTVRDDLLPVAPVNLSHGWIATNEGCSALAVWSSSRRTMTNF